MLFLFLRLCQAVVESDFEKTKISGCENLPKKVEMPYHGVDGRLFYNFAGDCVFVENSVPFVPLFYRGCANSVDYWAQPLPAKSRLTDLGCKNCCATTHCVPRKPQNACSHPILV